MITSVSHVQVGDVIYHRRGEMTVIAAQSYGDPRYPANMAVLVKTPRGKTVCFSFISYDTVEVVR